MQVKSRFLIDYEIQFLTVFKEQGYGMLVVTEGTIVYFEYNQDEEDWIKRTGSVNGGYFETYKEHMPNLVTSYYFNYTDGSFLFIDSARLIHKLTPTITPAEQIVPG